MPKRAGGRRWRRERPRPRSWRGSVQALSPAVLGPVVQATRATTGRFTWASVRAGKRTLPPPLGSFQGLRAQNRGSSGQRAGDVAIAAHAKP